VEIVGGARVTGPMGGSALLVAEEMGSDSVIGGVRCFKTLSGP